MTSAEKVAAIQVRHPSFRIERKNIPTHDSGGAKVERSAVVATCEIGGESYELSSLTHPEIDTESTESIVIDTCYRQLMVPS